LGAPRSTLGSLPIPTNPPIDTPAAAAPIVPDLPEPGRVVYRHAIGVLILTFLLLFLGAEVTSTNSGMAFRTWPDSDGRYLWPTHPTLSGILEHSHRLLGVLVGVGAILLLIHVRRLDRRPLMRKLSLWLLAGVALQGLLGGFRVLLNDHFPVLFPFLHGTLAHLVFSFMGFVAFAGSLAWVPRAVADAGHVGTARKMAVFAWVTVFGQILLGVATRHSNSDVAKWAHISFSLVASLAVLVAVSFSMGKFRSIPGFNRANRTTLAILVAQILLGFVALIVRRPKELADTHLMGKASMVSLHVVVGAWLLLMLTILVARSYRNLVPRAAR
jgi:heme a synthase